MQCLGRMCVTECFLPLIVENILLRDRVERISIELLLLLLYTVDIYKNYETFPCGLAKYLWSLEFLKGHV